MTEVTAATTAAAAVTPIVDELLCLCCCWDDGYPLHLVNFFIPCIHKDKLRPPSGEFGQRLRDSFLRHPNHHGPQGRRRRQQQQHKSS